MTKSSATKPTSAILIHGKPSRAEYYDSNQPSTSNANWFPWLQKQLLTHGIPTQTPEMPNSWAPHYPIWQREFERYDIGPGTLLVGHSRGAAFLVRWLSQHPTTIVNKVVLVAPSIYLTPDDHPDFFDVDIDPELAARTQDLIIFHSNNDKERVQRSVAALRQTIHNIGYREFRDYGHFISSSMPTDQFPELLEELIV